MNWNNVGKAIEDWKPPTKLIKMPFQKWLSHANFTDESKIGPDMEHWYYSIDINNVTRSQANIFLRTIVFPTTSRE